jgi:methylated-DNA-[protein]-cysteine S-methyltransferase
MNKTLFLHHQLTDIGKVGIAECNDCITNLFFESSVAPQDAEFRETALITEAFRQLNSYLAGNQKEFSFPIAPTGTPFMLHVWKNLGAIPYGTTVTYKDIAVITGNILAVRAVGMANHRNPIPVFIPCHRVVGSNGTLTGYRGGLVLKKQLLALEQRYR